MDPPGAGAVRRVASAVRLFSLQALKSIDSCPKIFLLCFWQDIHILARKNCIAEVAIFSGANVYVHVLDFSFVGFVVIELLING